MSREVGALAGELQLSRDESHRYGPVLFALVLKRERWISEIREETDVQTKQTRLADMEAFLIGLDDTMRSQLPAAKMLKRSEQRASFIKKTKRELGI